MLTETYKGRKLQATRNRAAGTVQVKVNGQPFSNHPGRDEEAALRQVHGYVDLVDSEPVNGDRWAAYWYAPGTYRMCGQGLHPVALDGECQHITCKRRRGADPDELPLLT